MGRIFIGGHKEQLTAVARKLEAAHREIEQSFLVAARGVHPIQREVKRHPVLLLHRRILVARGEERDLFAVRRP